MGKLQELLKEYPVYIINEVLEKLKVPDKEFETECVKTWLKNNLKVDKEKQN